MAIVLKAIGAEGENMDVMLIGKIFCLMLILQSMKNIDLSRKHLFEHIKSLQCYELIKRSSPLPLMLVSPLTYCWSVHCTYALRYSFSF